MSGEQGVGTLLSDACLCIRRFFRVFRVFRVANTFFRQFRVFRVCHVGFLFCVSLTMGQALCPLSRAVAQPQSDLAHFHPHTTLYALFLPTENSEKITIT